MQLEQIVHEIQHLDARMTDILWLEAPACASFSVIFHALNGANDSSLQTL